ncbi:MAG: cytochrome c family protein [Robiginitomaculum sp.]|nr:cytochrome c family protein [Robiginitomaculum sp.]
MSPFQRSAIFSSVCLLLSACGAEPTQPANTSPANTTPAPAPVNIELPAELAGADLRAGQGEYAKCRACHTVDTGGPNRVGPNLYGIFGQATAQNPKFRYSKPMQNSDIVWDIPTMDQWLANPRTFLPGTSMIFVGVRDDTKRKNLMAYLYVQTGGEAQND